MFAQLESAKVRSRWSRAVCIAIHGVVLFLLIRPPRPIFVSPSSVAWGQHGTSHSTTLVYLAQAGAEDQQPASAKTHRALTAPARNQRPKRRLPQRLARLAQKKGEIATAAPRAGEPWGSLLNGPVEGHDVRPAIPTVFPDPEVYPWQIPSGVQGKVVVEITIDVQGNVTDTKVLQALGYGIEDKVLAALRKWHFRPATIDGRPIASQQDVHFRFPG